MIAPALDHWLAASDVPSRARRRERIGQCFGLHGAPAWDEERVLERYELLYEAGLVYEAARDRAGTKAKGTGSDLSLGKPMIYDHRRILATAMGRLRGKLKYRPVIFELMPETFTLSDLQHTVEAISGARLHKQNFRRLVENAGLVEETGTYATRAMGRPAQLFRFRREVVSRDRRPASSSGARAICAERELERRSGRDAARDCSRAATECTAELEAQRSKIGDDGNRQIGLKRSCSRLSLTIVNSSDSLMKRAVVDVGSELKSWIQPSFSSGTRPSRAL